LGGVCGSEPTDVFVVGRYGTILHGTPGPGGALIWGFPERLHKKLGDHFTPRGLEHLMVRATERELGRYPRGPLRWFAGRKGKPPLAIAEFL
jgi:hypothetical protein